MISKQKRRSLRLESLETRKLMAGDLDTSFFYGHGYAVEDIDLTNEQVMDMTLQNDGKMIVAGSSDFGSGDVNFMLSRFDSNGDLDLTFGGQNGVPAGFVVTDFGGNEFVQNVFVLDDGDILAGGLTLTAEGNTLINLFRYNSDGSPEESFGIDGHVQIEWPGIHAGFDMGVVSDKILLRFNDHIMRLNLANGLLDNTFIGGGAVNTDLSFQFDATQMFVLGDDIYLGGEDNVSGDFTVLKMDMNANIDVGFGTNGRANLDPSIGTIVDAILDGDGRFTAVNSDELFRLDTNGDMDSQLHVDGIVELNDMNATQVLIQPGGLISIVGYTPGGSADVSVRRFGESGVVDNSFGNAGKSVFDMDGANYLYASSAFSLANKDILIAGNMKELNISSNDIMVARVDGSNTPAFDIPTDDFVAPSLPPSRNPIKTDLVNQGGDDDDGLQVLAKAVPASQPVQELEMDQFFLELEEGDADPELEAALRTLLPTRGL